MPQPPRRRPPVALKHTTWLRHSQLEWLIPGITPRLGLGVGETSWVLLYCTCQPWRGSSRSLAAVPPISTGSIGRIYSECPVKHVLYFTLQPRQQITLSASHPPIHSISLPPSLSIYTTLSSTHPRILCATSVHLVYLAPGHLPLTIQDDPHRRYTYTIASAHTFRLPRGFLLPPPLHAPFSQFSAPF